LPAERVEYLGEDSVVGWMTRGIERPFGDAVDLL